MRIGWNRSEDGYVESKCGRFSISPLLYSRCNPVEYEILDNVTGRKRNMDTQRECKAEAASWTREVIDG